MGDRFAEFVIPTRWHALFYGILLGLFIAFVTHDYWSVAHVCQPAPCF